MIDFSGGVENGRPYLIRRPSLVFNGGLLIMLHGAKGNPFNYLENQALDFTTRALEAGFMIVIPSAVNDFQRSSFFHPRWQSEFQYSTDSKFIQYLITTLKTEYNRLNGIQIRNIFIVGGSSGGLMASRCALDGVGQIKGIVHLNSLCATQVSLVNDAINYSGPVVVAQNHPPILGVASTVDELFPYANRMSHYTALSSAGVDVQTISHTGGEHGWTNWALQYHAQMINWLVSKNT